MKNIFENNEAPKPELIEEAEIEIVECAGHSYDGDGICRICGTIDPFRPLGHITSVTEDEQGITVQGTLTEAGEYFMKAVDDEI